MDRWRRPGQFLVADTSCYVKADKLETWDLGLILGLHGDPVHLLIPMVVIDKLDRLKDIKDRHTRWRAGYTLAVLDRVLSGSTVIGTLRAEDATASTSHGIPRGEVTVEIVMDPAGHTRLPINDDEIIDRAAAIQTLAGRTINFLTYDTGQDHRGRLTGLSTTKLAPPGGIGPEPSTAN